MLPTRFGRERVAFSLAAKSREQNFSRSSYILYMVCYMFHSLYLPLLARSETYRLLAGLGYDIL